MRFDLFRVSAFCFPWETARFRRDRRRVCMRVRAYIVCRALQIRLRYHIAVTRDRRRDFSHTPGVNLLGECRNLVFVVCRSERSYLFVNHARDERKSQKMSTTTVLRS